MGTAMGPLRNLWCALFGVIFNVGYGICSDLRMLVKSWPFVSNILADPERIIDLEVLDSQVRSQELR